MCGFLILKTCSGVFCLKVWKFEGRFSSKLAAFFFFQGYLQTKTDGLN